MLVIMMGVCKHDVYCCVLTLRDFAWVGCPIVVDSSPISICSAEFREGVGQYKCRVVHVPTLARLFSMMEAALPVTSHDEDSMDGNAVLSGQSKQQRRRQNK